MSYYYNVKNKRVIQAIIYDGENIEDCFSFVRGFNKDVDNYFRYSNKINTYFFKERNFPSGTVIIYTKDDDFITTTKYIFLEGYRIYIPTHFYMVKSVENNDSIGDLYRLVRDKWVYHGNITEQKIQELKKKDNVKVLDTRL